MTTTTAPVADKKTNIASIILAWALVISVPLAALVISAIAAANGHQGAVGVFIFSSIICWSATITSGVSLYKALRRG